MNCVIEFHKTMRIRIDGLDRAVEQIMELVRRLPCASVDLDDVDLALHEALANAVVHGNKQDLSKSVQICGGCERSGDLLLAITDQGGGFDHNGSGSHGRRQPAFETWPRHPSNQSTDGFA